MAGWSPASVVIGSLLILHLGSKIKVNEACSVRCGIRGEHVCTCHDGKPTPTQGPSGVRIRQDSCAGLIHYCSVGGVCKPADNGCPAKAAEFPVIDFTSTPFRTECFGQLEIVHANKNSLFNIDSFNLDGKRKNYPNIARGFPIFKRNIIIHVESNECCWELYGKRNFKGQKQIIFPGSRVYPEFRPASIKKVLCSKTYD